MIGATLKGRNGRYHVWHRGPNNYAVTEGETGPVIGTRTQYGLAWSLASRLAMLEDQQ